MYRPGSRDSWRGRIDSTEDYEAFRWHQWIRPVDLDAAEPAAFGGARAEGGAGPWAAVAFLGFACDEGVRRNMGRPGARGGPAAIRAELSNLPCSFDPGLALYDAGEVECEGGALEEAQALLGAKVRLVRERGWFPVVLGGGHETAYGHWLGQRGPGGGPAILNLDAHLDLRPYPAGGSSGSMFRQVADELAAEGGEFRYLCLGAQLRSNTRALFRDAGRLGARWILGRDLAEAGAASAFPAIDALSASAETLMVTICADVFSSAWAPGVSAPQPLGLEPEIVIRLVKRAFAGGRVSGLDLCEVSPGRAGPDPTASLAATLIFAAVNAHAEAAGLADGIA